MEELGKRLMIFSMAGFFFGSIVLPGIGSITLGVLFFLIGLIITITSWLCKKN